jgi:uncharacterized membrane protein YhiD involved in acid resistance
MQIDSTHFPGYPNCFKDGGCRRYRMLVGMEREWSNKDVGVRSFAIVALLGMLASVISNSIAIASLVGVLLLIAAMNTRSILSDHSLEITTSAALLVNYLLGVLVGLGHIFTPVAGAIVMTMLLAWKTELSRFAGGLLPFGDQKRRAPRTDRIHDLSGVTEALHRSLAVVQSQRCMDQRYRNRRDWIRELCVPEDLQHTRSAAPGHRRLKLKAKRLVSTANRSTETLAPGRPG